MTDVPRPAVLPSLARLRADLTPATATRPSMKGPLLAALLAAVAGLLAAAVMILGPTGGAPAMTQSAFWQSETR